MGAIRKCSSNFVETDIDDEKVVMSLDSGEFFALKDTGLAIWDLIDGSRDLAAIAAHMAQAYDAPVGQVTTDCETFLLELQSAGLVQLG